MGYEWVAIRGGHSITNIRYADDTVLLSESEKNLQRLLDVVVQESERLGLNINYNKTKCLVVSKKSSPKCNLKLKEQVIKQDSLLFLLPRQQWSQKMPECETEIKRRIALAKFAFFKVSKIMKKGTRVYEDQNKGNELLHLPSTYVW